LVIAETAIDALSYAAIKGTKDARFISTGGSLNQRQPDLITGAIQKLPKGGEVVLAFDNDTGGDELTETLKALFGKIKPAECVLMESRPPSRGMDWNDVLRASVAKTGPLSSPACRRMSVPLFRPIHD
jgi:hypothetical protein